jgi:hypothetical protein
LKILSFAGAADYDSFLWIKAFDNTLTVIIISKKQQILKPTFNSHYHHACHSHHYFYFSFPDPSINSVHTLVYHNANHHKVALTFKRQNLSDAAPKKTISGFPSDQQTI